MKKFFQILVIFCGMFFGAALQSDVAAQTSPPSNPKPKPKPSPRPGPDGPIIIYGPSSDSLYGVIDIVVQNEFVKAEKTKLANNNYEKYFNQKAFAYQRKSFMM